MGKTGVIEVLIHGGDDCSITCILFIGRCSWKNGFGGTQKKAYLVEDLYVVDEHWVTLKSVYVWRYGGKCILRVWWVKNDDFASVR